MAGQIKSTGWALHQEIAAVALEKARVAVNEIVAEFAGRTVSQPKSRTVARPGMNSVEPEPAASLEAALALERAAHALIEGYIRLAREAGRSWLEIGNALDLLSAAAANQESVGDEAYGYALRYQVTPGSHTFWWTCPACRNRVTDHGPWLELPKQEDGHASDCARRNAHLTAWRQRQVGN
jgi:hypothetical protein